MDKDNFNNLDFLFILNKQEWGKTTLLFKNKINPIKEKEINLVSDPIELAFKIEEIIKSYHFAIHQEREKRSSTRDERFFWIKGSQKKAGRLSETILELFVLFGANNDEIITRLMKTAFRSEKSIFPSFQQKKQKRTYYYHPISLNSCGNKCNFNFVKIYHNQNKHRHSGEMDNALCIKKVIIPKCLSGDDYYKHLRQMAGEYKVSKENLVKSGLIVKNEKEKTISLTDFGKHFIEVIREFFVQLACLENRENIEDILRILPEFKELILVFLIINELETSLSNLMKIFKDFYESPEQLEENIMTLFKELNYSILISDDIISIYNTESIYQLTSKEDVLRHFIPGAFVKIPELTAGILKSVMNEILSFQEPFILIKFPIGTGKSTLLYYIAMESIKEKKQVFSLFPHEIPSPRTEIPENSLILIDDIDKFSIQVFPVFINWIKRKNVKIIFSIRTEAYRYFRQKLRFGMFDSLVSLGLKEYNYDNFQILLKPYQSKLIKDNFVSLGYEPSDDLELLISSLPFDFRTKVEVVKHFVIYSKYKYQINEDTDNKEIAFKQVFIDALGRSIVPPSLVLKMTRYMREYISLNTKEGMDKFKIMFLFSKSGGLVSKSFLLKVLMPLFNISEKAYDSLIDSYVLVEKDEDVILNLPVTEYFDRFDDVLFIVLEWEHNRKETTPEARNSQNSKWLKELMNLFFEETVSPKSDEFLKYFLKWKNYLLSKDKVSWGEFADLIFNLSIGLLPKTISDDNLITIEKDIIKLLLKISDDNKLSINEFLLLFLISPISIKVKLEFLKNNFISLESRFLLNLIEDTLKLFDTSGINLNLIFYPMIINKIKQFKVGLRFIVSRLLLFLILNLLNNKNLKVYWTDIRYLIDKYSLTDPVIEVPSLLLSYLVNIENHSLDSIDTMSLINQIKVKLSLLPSITHDWLVVILLIITSKFLENNTLERKSIEFIQSIIEYLLKEINNIEPSEFIIFGEFWKYLELLEKHFSINKLSEILIEFLNLSFIEPLKGIFFGFKSIENKSFKNENELKELFSIFNEFNQQNSVPRDKIQAWLNKIIPLLRKKTLLKEEELFIWNLLILLSNEMFTEELILAIYNSLKTKIQSSKITLLMFLFFIFKNTKTNRGFSPNKTPNNILITETKNILSVRLNNSNLVQLTFNSENELSNFKELLNNLILNYQDVFEKNNFDFIYYYLVDKSKLETETMIFLDEIDEELTLWNPNSNLIIKKIVMEPESLTVYDIDYWNDFIEELRITKKEVNIILESSEINWKAKREKIIFLIEKLKQKYHPIPESEKIINTLFYDTMYVLEYNIGNSVTASQYLLKSRDFFNEIDRKGDAYIVKDEIKNLLILRRLESELLESVKIKDYNNIRKVLIETFELINQNPNLVFYEQLSNIIGTAYFYLTEFPNTLNNELLLKIKTFLEKSIKFLISNKKFLFLGGNYCLLVRIYYHLEDLKAVNNVVSKMLKYYQNYSPEIKAFVDLTIIYKDLIDWANLRSFDIRSIEKAALSFDLNKSNIILRKLLDLFEKYGDETIKHVFKEYPPEFIIGFIYLRKKQYKHSKNWFVRGILNYDTEINFIARIKRLINILKFPRSTINNLLCFAILLEVAKFPEIFSYVKYVLFRDSFDFALDFADNILGEKDIQQKIDLFELSELDSLYKIISNFNNSLQKTQKIIFEMRVTDKKISLTELNKKIDEMLGMIFEPFNKEYNESLRKFNIDVYWLYYSLVIWFSYTYLYQRFLMIIPAIFNLFLNYLEEKYGSTIYSLKSLRQLYSEEFMEVTWDKAESMVSTIESIESFLVKKGVKQQDIVYLLIIKILLVLIYPKINIDLKDVSLTVLNSVLSNENFERLYSIKHFKELNTSLWLSERLSKLTYSKQVDLLKENGYREFSIPLILYLYDYFENMFYSRVPNVS